MMFNNKFVCAIKVGGKILRESGDTVILPFGSEFSIFMKNLETRRAKVKVYVDGQDATEGVELVINCRASDNTFELSRFIKNGNLTSGNSFKFIEMTDDIERHRGVGAEDGLVRVEWEYELIRPTFNPPAVSTPWVQPTPYSPYPPYTIWSPTCDSNVPIASYSSAVRVASNASSAPASATTVSTQGITVPGTVSDQTFNHASWFMTDGVKHSMVIKLAGKIANTVVSAPVTVKSKPKCVTCGRQNKATANFCVNCGTSLQIV